MPRRLAIEEWPVVYGLMVLAVAGVMLYTMSSALSPILAFILLLLLLSPYAGDARHVRVVLAASLVLFVWVLETLGGMLAPFIIAIGIAYILDPAVDRLENRGLPRMVGVAILALPVLALLTVAAIFGIPALVGQIQNLVQSIPDAAERVVAWLQQVRGRLAAMNLPFLDTDRIAAMLSEENIAAYIQARQAIILERGWSAVLGVRHGVGIVITILSYVVLVPVLTVYLLRDFNKLTARATELMPERKRDGWVRFLREYDALLARFLRGQVLAATIVGILTWLGLWIVGFPYSGLVGAIAGVFNLVPYLGLVASIVPVILIALVTGNFLGSLLKAAIVFAIIQFIDGSITGPRIAGGSVGLNPVWVILALAVGSFFFGFVGLLLAMPAAVFIKLVVRESLARYRASRVFRGGASADTTA